MKVEEIGKFRLFVKRVGVKSLLEADMWEVLAKDEATDEKCLVEYCKWEEWLSFLTNKKDLQKYGIETYLVHCLRTMTSVAFSEEEIKKAFEEVKKQNFENAEV